MSGLEFRETLVCFCSSRFSRAAAVDATDRSWKELRRAEDIEAAFEKRICSLATAAALRAQ